MGERKNDNANDDLKNIDDFPGEPKQTRLREADHRDGRLDEDQGQIQRSGHTPGGKDLSRGSEPSTGGAKEQSSDKDPRTSNSELSEENSQALKNQGTANPGEYPDREETPT